MSRFRDVTKYLIHFAPMKLVSISLGPMRLMEPARAMNDRRLMRSVPSWMQVFSMVLVVLSMQGPWGTNI
jgi:hypothetical protein